jgi:hypothetical protein
LRTATEPAFWGSHELNRAVGLLGELFEDEGDEAFVVRVIHDELVAGRHADLVFNTYSVTIDPDAGHAVVCDLFDQAEVISLGALREALDGRPMAPPIPPESPGLPLGPKAGD